MKAEEDADGQLRTQESDGPTLCPQHVSSRFLLLSYFRLYFYVSWREIEHYHSLIDLLLIGLATGDSFTSQASKLG